MFYSTKFCNFDLREHTEGTTEVVGQTYKDGS